MAKFFGKVGYGEQVEQPAESGIFITVITERTYYGDVLRNTRDLDTESKVNGDISVGNSISIVSDAYAFEHMFAMQYVEWAGVKWIVSKVEDDPHRPRLTLRLGGVYNGPTV